MSSWFTKNLGDAMFAEDALHRIKATFLAEYEKEKQPKEMAIFIRHESEGRLHCEVKLYFSPASVAVATAVNASICARPSSDDLGLFAGSEDAWSALFAKSSPGSERNTF
jgi:hypothetical protein